MIYSYKQYKPDVHSSAYIAHTAEIIGRVTIGEQSSIWNQVVLRGDVNYISIGNNSNIQDGSICHVSGGQVSGVDFPLVVGNNVTVGHNAVLHACHIKNHCIIGMGAVLLDGSTIGEHCIVAAGSLVPPGKEFPPNSMILGSPAKVIRELKDIEIKTIEQNALAYVKLAQDYFTKLSKALD